MQTNGSAPQKSFLTTSEVGKLLGCSSYWVTVLVNRGELRTHRIGNAGWHRIGVRDIEGYAQKHNITIDWTLLASTRIPPTQTEGD